MISWKRSREGYVDSTCGRWLIEPLYFGSVKPQSYALFRDGARVGYLIATQREAKARADALDQAPAALITSSRKRRQAASDRSR